MESTLKFEAPFEGKTLSILLFREVANVKEIVAGLKAGTITPEAAFFDAAHVASVEVVQLAAYHAMVHESRQTLKSRTVHSEIVFNVSASNHIAEAYKRFGPTDHTQHLLVARFDATPEDLVALRSIVKGKEVAPSELSAIANNDALAKQYKVVEPERSLGQLQDAILGRIAIRDS